MNGKYQTFEGRGSVPGDVSQRFQGKWKHRDNKNFSESSSSSEIPLAIQSNKTLRKRLSKGDLNYDYNERKKGELYYQAIDQIFGEMGDDASSSGSSGEVDPSVEITSSFYTSLSGDIDVAEKTEKEIYASETIIPECYSEESSNLSESEGTFLKKSSMKTQKSKYPIIIKPQPPQKVQVAIPIQPTTPARSSMFSRTPRPPKTPVPSTMPVSATPSATTPSKTLETPSKGRGFSLKPKSAKMAAMKRIGT